jgi:hypothetical protein
MELNFGTINSIQQYYKLQSPFYFKKPKAHKKRHQKEKIELPKSNSSRAGKDKVIKGSVENKTVDSITGLKPEDISNEYIDKLLN